MRHRLLSALAPIGLGLLTLTGCGNEGSGSDTGSNNGIDPERVERGLAISPVPVNLEGKDRNLVGLGSYIVNAVAACNDCHTNPPYAAGGNPFAGEPEQINTAHFLAGGTVFPQAVSSNLTPDASGLPGGLTYEEYETLMRTGTEEDGEIIPVMPWPVYKSMTETDLRATYEYLRSIPAAQPGTAP
ncbi:MAG TPA: cytochrome C [Myxococcaceae bacterium]|nr:cytochrome C [Myxococcaceae bacterium]